ncbi:MAG TPA: SAM-dependent chlorinase/fluorinase [Gemmatimonadaceae bacterium]|nr:SAM-dependent chlorinase/fluorinase [Gemmatimonadaceae bacterium]
MRPIITLLSDFGTADGYVGEIKGVLLSALPLAAIVDITHDVAPQDVDGARLAVARYWRRFPEGTVHLVVVDPGVGTARAAIAVASDGRSFVGPDNGVLSPALLVAGARVVELPVPAGASHTFHGRDVFAPAAATLASGVPIDDLGTPLLDPIVRRTPEARRTDDGEIEGEVISVDRFGNLITNLVAPRGGSVRIGDREVPLGRTYADAASGAVLALVGSSGLVEIAVRDGSAANSLGLTRGARVILQPPRR